MSTTGTVLGTAAMGGSDNFRIEMKGLQAAADKVFAIGQVAVVAFAAGVHDEAEEIIAKAKSTEVPVDSGNLRNSGFAPEPVITSDSVEQIIGFGGPAADYALPVHEIPPPPAKSAGGRSARHDPPHGKGGKWKYLEDPFVAAVESGLEQRVADHVGDALAGI